MMDESLAGKLRLLRAERGLTLKDAAKLLGVDRHTLRRAELGTQETMYPTLAKIASGYGVSVGELLGEPAAPLAEAPEAGPTVKEGYEVVFTILYDEDDAEASCKELARVILDACRRYGEVNLTIDRSGGTERFVVSVPADWEEKLSPQESVAELRRRLHGPPVRLRRGEGGPSRG
jgi:transcriptional regulator with XRE-family HTH domain